MVVVGLRSSREISGRDRCQPAAQPPPKSMGLGLTSGQGAPSLTGPPRRSPGHPLWPASPKLPRGSARSPLGRRNALGRTTHLLLQRRLYLVLQGVPG